MRAQFSRLASPSEQLDFGSSSSSECLLMGPHSSVGLSSGDNYKAPATAACVDVSEVTMEESEAFGFGCASSVSSGHVFLEARGGAAPKAMNLVKRGGQDKARPRPMSIENINHVNQPVLSSYHSLTHTALGQEANSSSGSKRRRSDPSICASYTKRTPIQAAPADQQLVLNLSNKQPHPMAATSDTTDSNLMRRLI